VRNCARLRTGASIEIYIDMSAKFSILGLGIMGAAMARGGLNTTARDRSPERASSFAYDKVQIAQCARDAVQDADIVVTMVSNADAVLSIMKEREVLPAMKPGAVWIQMSTIGVEGTERAWRLAGTRPEIGSWMRRFRAAKLRRNKGNSSFLRRATKVEWARQHSHSSMQSQRRHIGSVMWDKERA
jgi:hypothetical protein